MAASQSPRLKDKLKKLLKGNVFVLRLLLFTGTQVVAIAISIILSSLGLNYPVYNVLESLSPVMTFLVFGTTEPIFRTWCFSKRDYSNSIHTTVNQTPTDEEEGGHEEITQSMETSQAVITSIIYTDLTGRPF
ncbi:hypothetical protein M422DRAFT_245452 [Sphaerobolus stellatus SS14]|nr:hypothetical protein M422DRAFT_245452 [Sphaerobolus stellatus SS14]